MNHQTHKYEFEIDDSAPSDPNDPTNNGVPSNYENFITIDKNQFNSDKLKKIGENKFQATDVYTKKKFNVIRDEKGKYKKDGQ